MINNPPIALRQRIEAEAKAQKRSMNNLLIVVLTKFFKLQDLDTRTK
jgi:hypothetical protein